MPIVDEYLFTPCARKAIDEGFPETIREPEFSAAMKVLQKNLILCNFKDMDGRTKARALKTLGFLGFEN